MARALAADPPVLLMDEPFGAVDPVRRGALQQEFKRLQRDLGKTVVFVTHDVDEAVLLGDRIAIMQQGGKVAQYGPPEALLAQPAERLRRLVHRRHARDQAALAAPRGRRPLAELGADGIGGWTLRRPARAPPDRLGARRRGRRCRSSAVGPGGTLRDLLDSALASPARAAVRVDEHGALLGAVPFDTLEEHLPAPQRAAAEA